MKLLPVYLNNKVGFIDKQGNIVIEPKFDKGGEVCISYCFDDNGQAVVTLNNKLGVIDETGEFVIPPIYDRILEKKGNYWYTSLKGKYGILDKDGSFKKTFYGKVGYFSEGLMAVELGRWLYLDEDWQIVIPPQSFREAFHFSDGLAVVGVEILHSKVKRRYGFIDKQGKFVMPVDFEYAYAFSEGLAAIQLHN